MEQEVKPSLIGMFKNPGEQFDRMRVNPTIWIPLLIVTILYTIGMYLSAMALDASYLGFEGMSEEEIEIALIFSKVSVILTGIFAPAVGTLISSAIYLIFTKIARSGATFRQLYSMNIHIMFISAAGLILNMLLRLLIGGNPDIMVTSLAALVNSDKIGVLAAIELFSIWQLILAAIGLHRLAGLSKGWAWGIAIGFFFIGLLFAYIGGLITGVMGV